MATINAAKAIGIDKELGSIECGKQADLVLVDEIDRMPFVEQLFIKGKKVMGRDRNSLSDQDNELLVKS
jgi:imidazolonepropionase-like amidohydrolase